MMEDWRMVKDFEGLYWINSIGQIKNKNGKVLKHYRVGGIESVTLYGSGLRQEYPINVLLARNFPEKYMEE